MNTDTDDLEDIRALWSAQSHGRMSADVSEIMNEVRHKDVRFRRTIFWRDLREVGVALVLLPVWVWLGVKLSLPWTWYLVMPGLLWIAGFLLVGRFIQKRKQGQPGESLKEFVGHSIAQVDHQIWLLRNVLWWYLLPIFLPDLSVLFLQMAWQAAQTGEFSPGQMAARFTIPLLVCIGAWWINQYAVRSDLEPRRKELEALLRDLEEDP